MAEMVYQQRPNKRADTDRSQQRPGDDRLLEGNKVVFKGTAQLEAMTESSPQTNKQARLAAMINSSPAMVAQRKVVEDINSSPYVTTQRQKLESLAGGSTRQLKEESPQGKLETAQRVEEIANPNPNNTGLPDNLKSGIEALSGISMDNVKVHYNSSQPAQLNALAYAQGTDIHVAPGQEQHLPHEAWHVVQQAQGRVRPTMQMKDGVPVNDDKGLEREADLMGEMAVLMMRGQSTRPALLPPIQQSSIGHSSVSVQRIIGDEKTVKSKVINKKTKHIYIIEGYSPQKGYKLIHNALVEPPIYVLPDDDNYDFFAAPDIAEEQVKSSGLSGFFSHLFGGSQEPLTTSGSYETGRKKEIAESWPEIKHQVKQIKEQAIALEKSKPGSSAFYNAAGLGAYTLHRVILAIYEEIEEVRTKNHVFFRAPGNTPREEASKGPESFLASRKPSNWSDHQETDSMMSVNIAVSANVADTAESTFSILQTGGLFDLDPKKTVIIVAKMLESMGIIGGYAEVILKEVKDLASIIAEIKTQNSQSGTQESVLYQTFIPKNLISRLVYIAQTNGHPLDYEYSMVDPEKVLMGIIAAGEELSNQEMQRFGATYVGKVEQMVPEEKKTLFQGSQFTNMVLEAAKATSFWAVLKGQRDPQARILMHPKVFAEPSGLAETVTHKNLSERTSAVLEQGLEQIHGTTAKVKLLMRIEDMATLYGAVFLRLEGIMPKLNAEPNHVLQRIIKEMSLLASEVNGRVQEKIWDYIGDRPRLKEQIKSGLDVTCRGEKVKFDIDIPAKMFPNEFDELLILLEKLDTLPVKESVSNNLLKLEDFF